MKLSVSTQVGKGSRFKSTQAFRPNPSLQMQPPSSCFLGLPLRPAPAVGTIKRKADLCRPDIGLDRKQLGNLDQNNYSVVLNFRNEGVKITLFA
jgi:hypothetical protein